MKVYKYGSAISVCFKSKTYSLIAYVWIKSKYILTYHFYCVIKLHCKITTSWLICIISLKPVVFLGDSLQ